MIKTFFLDLDADKFNKKLESSAKKLDEFGSTGLSKMINGFETMATAIKGIAVVGLVGELGKLTFELIKGAEEATRMKNAFELLGRSAGVATDTLIKGLEEASQGLVDDDELIQIANKSIVALGKSAERLPEIMEVARKATVAMGGSTKEHFEALSHAIETGNTRALRNIGINIDATKVYKEYARSLGITEDRLTQVGKQHALMNAILGETSAKFGEVDGKQKTLAERFDSYWIAAKNGVKEATVSTIDFFDRAIKKVQELREADRQRVREAQGYINVENKGDTSEHAKVGPLKRRDASGDIATESPEETKRKADEKARVTKQFYQDLFQMREQYNNDALRSAETIEQWEVARAQQAQMMEEERRVKQEQIEQNKLLSVEQKQMLLEQLEMTHQQRLAAIQNSAAEDKKKKMEELDEKAYQSQNTFASGWNRAAKSAAKDFGDMRMRGAFAFQTIGKNAVSAFEALGDGSKDAGEAMKGFMFGSIADIATAEGTKMLLTGIWPPNPLAIAGGGALIALGSSLRSQSKGSSSGIGYSGGGGGDAASAGAGADSSKPEVKEAKTKAFQLTVNGNIFETDQTKTHILELIRQGSDATNFDYNQIGVGRA